MLAISKREAEAKVTSSLTSTLGDTIESASQTKEKQLQDLVRSVISCSFSFLIISEVKIQKDKSSPAHLLGTMHVKYCYKENMPLALAPISPSGPYHPFVLIKFEGGPELVGSDILSLSNLLTTCLRA